MPTETMEVLRAEVVIDSRTVAVGFYEKLGNRSPDGSAIKSGSFDCIRMTRRPT